MSVRLWAWWMATMWSQTRLSNWRTVSGSNGLVEQFGQMGRRRFYMADVQSNGNAEVGTDDAAEAGAAARMIEERPMRVSSLHLTSTRRTASISVVGSEGRNQKYSPGPVRQERTSYQANPPVTNSALRSRWPQL